MADDVEVTSESWFSVIVSEIFYSPFNLVLIVVCALLIYKLFGGREDVSPPSDPIPELPPLKRQDLTLEQLQKYDGRGEEERICVAVNGKIFDVTKGKKFYGPGGPYSAFAGHDASRGLALFSVDTKDEYDDLSDLNTMQMESVREWEMQFTEKYHYVGRLLKPGEEPTEYSDDEEATQDLSQRVKEDNRTSNPNEAQEDKKDN